MVHLHKSVEQAGHASIRPTRFCSWLANNPDSGDVIPGSGSCRKVRWKRRRSGKSGGVRVIYYNRLANGEIWLLTIYAKSAQENFPLHILKAIKEAIDHA